MYEDIFELITIAAQKRNLRESTSHRYCQAITPFLKAANKHWQELTVEDADDYLTSISRTNHSIHIRNGKNRMDRYTILADRTLDLLTEYWYKCGRPRDILFPSQATKNYLTPNSVNQTLKETLARLTKKKEQDNHSCPKKLPYPYIIWTRQLKMQNIHKPKNSTHLVISIDAAIPFSPFKVCIFALA